MQHTGELRKRRRDVLHVLIDLGGHNGVKALICAGQRTRVGVFEAQLAITCRAKTSRGDRQHGLADVGAQDGAVRCGAGGQLGREEARARPDVEHPLARLDLERIAHRLALGDDIGRAVDRLDPS